MACFRMAETFNTRDVCSSLYVSGLISSRPVTVAHAFFNSQLISIQAPFGAASPVNAHCSYCASQLSNPFSLSIHG